MPEGKQRTLLTALLLRAGRVVAAGELAELLWAPVAPPPSAPVTVRNYVKRLRHTLRAAGQDRIVTQAGGYLIRVERGELDVWVMEDALAVAHRAAREAAWHDVARQATVALELWRGEPLSGLDLPTVAAAEMSRLTELQLQAHELRIEADLHLGLHAGVVTELRQLTGAHPLREHLHALLMLALYRCGRRAEALQAYRESRDVLIEEIGNEPGPELQALHQQILRDAPALAPTSAEPRPARAEGPTATAPRQLPRAVRCFTGRDAELSALSAMLSDISGGGTLVISAIAGTAGVGKTATAVRWAHQIAARFPDGQLYVNLRGYDPDQPVLAGDALAGFLRALGVPGQDIPDELEDRARLYRSRLAGCRVLVLLDNARDGEQVRPLLPGDPGCVAVVTSRDALAGLVAADGAVRLDLDVLPRADAIALLRSLIGPRADQEPEAVAALAGLCARLPLALRIAAEEAVARPAVPLAALVAELEARQLDLLDAGEDHADVRAVLSWSFRQLPDDVAGAFALMGLHPGADLDVYAAAALTGTAAGPAGKVLGRLHRASLVQATGAGRYGMHDLLRAYAREQAAARDAGGQRERALTRLFDYYLAATAAAMDVVFPAEARQRPRVLRSAALLPAVPGEADARAWLDAERANLVGVVVHCAAYGWPEHAAGLAGILFRYLIDGCHLPEADTIYSHVLQDARQSGDLAAEAEALNGLGGIGIMKGRFGDAAGHYQAALECYRQRGDPAGQA
ncbi:MAG TPA: BTAD domain-containing putative transcriptional regulator, partial [Streptosporangiaceae bacterium]|nr:BTAD domain-containing putative transcriptional regulator [Streptosporangiaceae bacterium]